MRGPLLALALLGAGCASTQLKQVSDRAETVCVRFEQYQLAHDGKITAPCSPQDGHGVAAGIAAIGR